MYVSSITTAGVASSVWSSVTRNLTSFGSSLLSLVSQAQTTIAAGSAVDARPGAGKIRELSVGAQAAGGGSITIEIFDGSNARALATIAASQSGGGTGWGNATVGIRIHNNDGANAGNYMYGGADWGP